MANKDNLYGDAKSPAADRLSREAMKQVDKSDITVDVNGVSDDRATTDKKGD